MELSPQRASTVGHYKYETIQLISFFLQPQKTFEMKVNISGTEFVVLENVKTVDTHAVVLKVLQRKWKFI